MAKNSRSIYIVAFMLFFIGISYMIWSGVSQNSMYFLNVSEALAMESDTSHNARLFGTVSKDDLKRHDSGLGVDFRLVDATNSMQHITVYYKGVVPDTFDVGAEVIIEGVMQNSNFHAKSLMTKCPSKYEKDNRPENA